MENNKLDGMTKSIGMVEYVNGIYRWFDSNANMVRRIYAADEQRKTQQEAIDYADSIIRKTMGSTRATDVSSMVRTKGATKIFFMFQTFLIHNSTNGMLHLNVKN